MHTDIGWPIERRDYLCNGSTEPPEMSPVWCYRPCSRPTRSLAADGLFGSSARPTDLTCGQGPSGRTTTCTPNSAHWTVCGRLPRLSTCWFGGTSGPRTVTFSLAPDRHEACPQPGVWGPPASPPCRVPVRQPACRRRARRTANRCRYEGAIGRAVFQHGRRACRAPSPIRPHPGSRRELRHGS